jgi:hypothetical protein
LFGKESIHNERVAREGDLKAFIGTDIFFDTTWKKKYSDKKKKRDEVFHNKECGIKNMSLYFGTGCLKVGLSYEEGSCWVGKKVYLPNMKPMKKRGPVAKSSAQLVALSI